jgi:hypothetical protein
MPKKVTTLCKWKKKKFEKDYNKLKSIVYPPKYICKKCGRAAVNEEYLCKPVYIADCED